MLGHTSLVGLRMMQITPHPEPGDHLRERKILTLVLIGVSLVAIAVSFVSPQHALWSFMLAFAGPLLRHWSRRRSLAD